MVKVGGIQSLRPFERETFQAFTDHADEDNLGRHQRFADEDGRHAGNRNGQVCPEPTLQKTFQRAIQHPSALGDTHNQRTVRRRMPFEVSPTSAMTACARAREPDEGTPRRRAP